MTTSFFFYLRIVFQNFVFEYNYSLFTLYYSNRVRNKCFIIYFTVVFFLCLSLTNYSSGILQVALITEGICSY